MEDVVGFSNRLGYADGSEVGSTGKGSRFRFHSQSEPFYFRVSERLPLINMSKSAALGNNTVVRATVNEWSIPHLHKMSSNVQALPS